GAQGNRAREVLAQAGDEEESGVVPCEHEPVAAGVERALRRIGVPVDEETLRGSTNRMVVPAVQIAAVGAAHGPNVLEEQAGRERQLERTGSEDALGVEVGVREPRRETDTEPDVHLVTRAADDAHGARLPGDELVVALLLVERPVREVGAQRRLGAQTETIDEVRSG